MIERLAKKRVKLFPGREGQSLLLFALMLPLILLFVAFVVDGAHAFVDYRHLQNAADASSLAAAQDINSPSCTKPQLQCIQEMVTDYANQNGEWPSKPGLGNDIQQCGTTGVQPPNGPAGGSVEACFEWPYNGTDPTRVLVKIRDCTQTLIGQYFGVDKICSSVRSVSISSPQTTTSVIGGTTIDPSTITNYGTTTIVSNGSTITTPVTSVSTIPGTTIVNTSTVFSTSVSSSSSVSTSVSGGTPRALFANNPICGPNNGIVFDSNPGSNIDAVESNGSVNLPSSNKGVITAAYLPTGKTVTIPPCFNDQSSAGGVQNAYALAATTWPATFDRAAICAQATINSTNGKDLSVVNPADGGIYCSTTSITLTGISGRHDGNACTRPCGGVVITLVAPLITIPNTENHFDLDAAYHDPSNGFGLTLWQTTSGGTTGTDTSGQTFVFNNNNSSINDVLWIQNGDLEFPGNSGSTGFYEAQNIRIGGKNGNSYQMRGAGPPIGQTTVYSTTTSYATTSNPVSTLTNSTTVPTTVTNISNSTSTTPNSTSVSTSTSRFTIPGTTQPDSTTVKTTGTNLALNQ
jgi:hypothetical protein